MNDSHRAIGPCGPVSGRFHVPGSKSLTNRALVCAALAQGASRIENASDSDDAALMANGLNQLGVLVRKEGEALVVEGKGGRLHAPRFPIPVGNAGTTFRFLLAVAGLASGETAFEVSDRMAARPIEELQAALRSLGIDVSREIPGSRFLVHGGLLRGGSVTLEGRRSSQFLSSIMLVAPFSAEETVVTVEGPLVSASYVAMTQEVMQHFGGSVRVEGSGDVYRISRDARYVARSYEVESDASSATYGFAAAAISGGEVVVPGLRLSSRQPDAGFCGILRRMGCDVEESGAGIRVRGGTSLSGVDVDMLGCPDAVPALAAVAVFAGGPTHMRNVGHLRHKESDRLSAIAGELRKIGADVVVDDGGLLILPGPLHGGVMKTHNDHRLAMSFSLIGLRVPGILIENPGCVAKSFPRYWEEFERLQGGR